MAVENFSFGDVRIDFPHAVVTRGGANVNLAAKEAQLLRYLIENRDRVVPRGEIMERVWAYSAQATSRTIDTHIAWLRRKLEDDSKFPRFIRTIRGKGYKFVACV